jgi:pimeloyl-ACP methyl ester carboxylesterase
MTLAGHSVVLIHGAGGSHLDWPAELRRMPGQHVYALDLPGHGKSEGLGRQSIPWLYQYAMVEWLDAMHISRAVSRSGIRWVARLP